MKTPPVFVKLTTNSVRDGMNEPFFVNPEDIAAYQPGLITDLTRRDQARVTGAIVFVRGQNDGVWVLEPVEEVVSLIGRARQLAVRELDPNTTMFPGYVKQPFVEADHAFIHAVRETQAGLNEMELYGDEGPFTYQEVKDALFKATVEWDRPKACADHRYNADFGRPVLELLNAAREKRAVYRQPMLDMQAKAGGMPTEGHGVERKVGG